MIKVETTGQYDHKEYQKELYRQISEYLRTYFYDGPYDVNVLMSNVMREGGGQLDPDQVLPVIESFLQADIKFLFEYQ